MQEDQSQPSRITSILRKVPPKSDFISKILPICVILVVVAAGVFSGLVFSSRNKSTKENRQKAALSEETLSGEQKQSFNQTFRDETEGVIEKNDKLDKYLSLIHI